MKLSSISLRLIAAAVAAGATIPINPGPHWLSHQNLREPGDILPDPEHLQHGAQQRAQFQTGPYNHPPEAHHQPHHPALPQAPPQGGPPHQQQHYEVLKHINEAFKAIQGRHDKADDRRWLVAKHGIHKMSMMDSKPIMTQKKIADDGRIAEQIAKKAKGHLLQ